MADAGKIIIEGGTGEVIEKKSRFISGVFPVHSEEEALSVIENVKKKYWDARHNCYAFVIGYKSEIQRYSDDGEPGGTAGKPILDVLLTEELRDCLIVVTRYFGGTLLGTGGLVRAYQQSAKAGLENSQTAFREKGVVLKLETDYNNVGKVQYVTSCEEKAYLINNLFTDKVEIKVLVQIDRAESFIKKITEAANGKIHINKEEEKFYAVIGQKPLLL